MDARIVDGRKIARVTDDGKLAVTVDLGTVELNQGAPGQNPWPVTLSGSLMEIPVNDWSELPDPTETPKGATAQLIGTFDVRQNNGSEWVEVVL